MPKQKKSAASSNGPAKKPRGKRASPLAAAVSAKASVKAVPAAGQPAAAAPSRKPPTDQVSARAHQIWLDAGKPQGQALEHWLRAERELS